MIHEMKVTNPFNDSWTLPLGPSNSGLIVKDIDGLTPPKSTVNLRENPGMNGSVLNSMYVPSRNIVLALQFVECPTIEAARLMTYKYFPLQARVKLTFRTDAGTYFIYGYVESNEPNIFSKDSGTVISIVCPDPDFQCETAAAVVGYSEGISSLFEFPFNAATIVFGEKIYKSVNFDIPFDSTVGVGAGAVDVGPALTLFAEGGPVNNPSILFFNKYDPSVVESMDFVFTTACPRLEAGDHLLIKTQRGEKSIQRYNHLTGAYINYLSTLSPGSSWPVLHYGGINLFSYEAASGAGYIRFKYEYNVRYSGI